MWRGAAVAEGHLEIFEAEKKKRNPLEEAEAENKEGGKPLRRRRRRHLLLRWTTEQTASKLKSSSAC